MGAVIAVFGYSELLIDDALRFYDLVGAGGADAAFRKQRIGGANENVGGEAPYPAGYVAGRMAHKIQIEHLVPKVHQQPLEPDVLIYIAAEVAPAVVEDENAFAEVFVNVLIGVVVVLHEPTLCNAFFKVHLLFVGYIYHRIFSPNFRRSVEGDDQSSIPYPIYDLLTKRGLSRPVFTHYDRYLRVPVLH